MLKAQTVFAESAAIDMANAVSNGLDAVRPIGEMLYRSEAFVADFKGSHLVRMRLECAASGMGTADPYHSRSVCSTLLWEIQT